METIVGISFKDNGKIYNFSNNLNLTEEDYVIVETERGLQFGKVVQIGNKIEKSKELKKVVRIADDKDINQNIKNIEDSKKSVEKATAIAKKKNLNMKFTEALFNFDRTQLVLYFVSENRVDFRELAKELASIYKTRIELRQIGVRDKAKEISGLGQCGRELCCACFLNDLDSVSISMAKEQNLALNPTKINGQCGRLLCCLKYENELYSELKDGLPTVGKRIKTNNGEGKVISINILNRSYVVEYDKSNREEIKLPSLTGCDNCEKKCNRNK
ncbi:stage 0 sporulation protein [bacterium]|nr:stage 0 sporulation protein [bacterium]